MRTRTVREDLFDIGIYAKRGAVLIENTSSSMLFIGTSAWDRVGPHGSPSVPDHDLEHAQLSRKLAERYVRSA